MNKRFLASVAAVLMCAGCGGGGGGTGTSQTDRTGAPRLTAGTAPVETPDDQASRAPGIIARADSLVVSTLYGETNSRLLPTYEVESSCSGSMCVFTEQTSSYRLRLDTDDIAVSGADAEAVLTKNGITTLERRETDFKSYGAWLSHSAFGVGEVREALRIAGTTLTSTARYAISGGDLTESRPAIVVTWRGLMTGMPVSGAARGNVLQGDALLTYKTAGNLIDAEFSNIVDLDLGRAHSNTSFRFLGVPVSATGTYAAGNKGNRIQGGIYGPGHAETAGIVERHGIVGSFGAKRQ